ncbi:MAG: hypothetical protein WCX69_03010 [Candidatus Paceibacterota bacterium]
MDTAKALNDQLNNLVEKAKTTSQNMRTESRKAADEKNTILADIDKLLGEIDQICSDVGQFEEEANGKIDRLILEEARLLAGED